MLSAKVVPDRSSFGPRPAGAMDRSARDPTPRAFWRDLQRFAPGDALPSREGPDRLASVVSGWACEVLVTEGGRRQILSFRLPGDLIVCGGVRSTRLIALTQLEVTPTHGAPPGHGTDAEAMLAVLARQNQWMCGQLLRLGGLDAYQRTAHLLLDFHDRLAAVGLVKAGSFRAPLTQDIFGEALGLSEVHVNRMLKRLRSAGLVQLRGGLVTLPDIDGLRTICVAPPRR